MEESVIIVNELKENNDLVRMLRLINEEFPREEYNLRKVLSLMDRAKKRIHQYVDVIGEKWKRIDNTEYFVSNHGHVRHMNSDGQNQKGYYSNGYSFVYFNKKSHAVHRLVAKAFIPNPDNLPIVNHKNEIRSDNNVDNLEWMTHGDNIAYSMMDRKRYKNIYVYNKEGKLILNTNGIKECIEKGYSREGVYSSLKLSTRTHKGMFFRDKKVDKESIIKNYLKRQSNIKNGRGTRKRTSPERIVNVIEEYMAEDVKIKISDIAKKMKVTRQTISNHITDDLKELIKDHNDSL